MNNNTDYRIDSASRDYCSPKVKVIGLSVSTVLCQSNLSEDDNNSASGHGMPWDD